MSFRRLSIITLLCACYLTLPPAFAAGSGGVSAAAAKQAAPAPQVRPLWAELTPAQQRILAPLDKEWNSFPEVRKKKWLEIANRYAALKPDEQNRLQERMREWVKLTPEQRNQARENYAHATQVKPEQRSAQWQQYQQLSEEQKKQLAEQHQVQKKKSLTNLSPESIKNPQIVAPIKVGPKPPPTMLPNPLVPPAANPAPAPASTTSLPAAPAVPATPVGASDSVSSSVPAEVKN